MKELLFKFLGVVTWTIFVTIYHMTWTGVCKVYLSKKKKRSVQGMICTQAHIYVPITI